jgi:hypothetical protein
VPTDPAIQARTARLNRDKQKQFYSRCYSQPAGHAMLPFDKHNRPTRPLPSQTTTPM